MTEGRKDTRLISRIANQFPNSLSRADVPSELVGVLDYYNNMEVNRMVLLQAMETLISCLFANHINFVIPRYEESHIMRAT
jgi:hypothetical protein